jgi:hypothetical protein
LRNKARYDPDYELIIAEVVEALKLRRSGGRFAKSSNKTIKL